MPFHYKRAAFFTFVSKLKEWIAFFNETLHMYIHLYIRGVKAI
jgi:hypothetical protein